MKRAVLILLSLAFLGCSYKTIIHKYPYLYTQKPDYSVDLLELYWVDDFIYLDKKLGLKQALFYTDGTLYVRSDSLGTIIWSKEDYFITPYTGIEYAIKAMATYDKGNNMDGFSVQIIEAKSDSMIAYIDGLTEDAYIFFDDQHFQITEIGFSNSRLFTADDINGRTSHYYPEGNLYTVSMNDVLIGGIVQSKQEINNHDSSNLYIIDLYTSLSDSSKSNLITSTLAYLALTDIEFYFYECNPYDVENTICPDTIIIE